MLSILVLGPGCYNCQKLAALCQEVVDEQGLEAAVEKITDLNQIHALGVMMTPGLVINGKVVTSGRVPSKHALEALILQADQ
ncbi:MAG: TM0996/MTH895 family glutaredoxin-like protein [Fidelibacterota bacterium]|nr:MAG: TM0996/MTH895 family glutaredoxin-like protein [Candidatus Neomarinimicrobiota bacterium]